MASPKCPHLRSGSMAAEFEWRNVGFSLDRELEPGRSGFHGCLVGIGALDLELPLVNAVCAGGKKGLKVRSAEADVGDAAVGCRDDAVDPAGLIADLDAHPRGDVESTVAVHPHAVGTAVVRGIGYVEVIVLLLVFQRTVGLNLVSCTPSGYQNPRHKVMTGRATA